MFKRKKPLDFYSQLRRLIWPVKGWERNFTYYWKRIVRIPDSPHSIAMGFSIGVFVAFTPFLGFHTILSIFIAWVLGANIISSLIGTFLGNPITYPLMWTFSYALGSFFFNAQSINYEKIEFSNFMEIDFFISFFLGSSILGFLFAISGYFLIKYSLIMFKKNRINKGK